jgi:sugar/nucleoside kinase (ribokinase family)
MAYEVFTRKTPRMGNPVVSFSKIGQIAFNQYAARLLQKARVEFVLLMWDPEARKIGIKTASEKDPRAYRMRYNDKGNGASFSAKTFLDFIGVDYSERKAIPVEIDATTELIVEVNVPDSFFAKKSALV